MRKAGIMVLALGLGAAWAAEPASSGLDRFKALAGDWVAAEDGEMVKKGDVVAQYHVTGAGSAVVEELFPGSHHAMTTVYHLDGSELVLTHYCMSGNQPRMRVREADGRHMSFEMFDITNLANPKGYHTTHLDLVFLSDDRVELTYRGISDGKESTQVLQLTRKKT